MAEIWGTDKAVIFGGKRKNSTTGFPDYLNESWIYDLSDNKWTAIIDPTRPQGLTDHGMASVWGTKKIILFGGGPSVNNDTWEYNYNNNSWTELNPVIRPSIRFFHGMSSIWGTDKVMVFGGKSGPDWMNDTWIYDLSDNTWTNMNPMNSPPERWDHEISPIWGTDKVLLFGGANATSSLNDTWEYDFSENNWIKKTTELIPEKRVAHAMSYIYGTNNVVLYGGYGQFPANDTWIFSNINSENSYVSIIYDTGTQSSMKELEWKSKTSINISIKFQLRSANSKDDLNSTNFVGPDGNTLSYYVNNPAIIWKGHFNERWIQYKAYFYTVNENESPTLEEVKIKYNCVPKTN